MRHTSAPPIRPRLAAYVRPDGLHTAFDFDFLMAGWDAKDLRAAIDDSLAMLSSVGATATWVLSNHDVMGHTSRYARPNVKRWIPNAPYLPDGPADPELGTHRARAAALLMLALPGGAYIYQGDELGLPEIEDLPEAVRQGPVRERSAHTNPGRDGCRVPIPGPATRSRSASAPPTHPPHPGCRNPRTGVAAASKHRPATRRRCWSRTAPP
ncbi:alpha-amylase family glycosyl hydrolase [Streptomyces sp. NPDC046931]|uniref:alpha-amylase family glycosyl hydrolase n=1 Tax=Streptomyces sp. NPDC046931 TaxID=3154806 RepID=UPI0033EDBE19